MSKHKPLSVETTIPGHPDPEDVKGRIITLEFASCYLVGTYVVNAGQNLKASPLFLPDPVSILITRPQDTWSKEYMEHTLFCLPQPT